MTNPVDNNVNHANLIADSKNKVTSAGQSENANTASSHKDVAKTANPEATDQVVLTEFAQKLQEIEKSLADQPVVNEAKVAKFKEMIENGEYNVDAVSVAEKIIATDKLL